MDGEVKPEPVTARAGYWPPGAHRHVVESGRSPASGLCNTSWSKGQSLPLWSSLATLALPLHTQFSSHANPEHILLSLTPGPLHRLFPFAWDIAFPLNPPLAELTPP
jgi:hypothetical protein